MSIEMRKQYASTLLELYEKDKNVYALEADLSSSMATASLKNTMHKNYINLGIMEANMVSVAAGINIAGGIPFVHSFGQFITRRAFDQVFVSLAYAKLHAILVGSDAGITAEHNGGTHMTFEDVGLMRTIPNAYIYDVCDPVQLKYILEKAYSNKGVHYIRTARKSLPSVYEDGETFENAKVLTEGTDVTIATNGICVKRALDACEMLKQEGINAEVIDMFSIQPLDKETLLKSAKKTNLVVTVENHNINNALGSAVAEVLSENYPTKLVRLGVKNQFGQVGSIDYLAKFYEIDAESIVKAVKKALNK